MKRAIEILEQDASLQMLNLTDPDAPLMKGKKGNFDTNYNVQIACGEDQIITYCDVIVQGNDKNQLEPVIKGVLKNTNKKIKSVLADADYGTFASFEFLEDKHITGYVPYRNMNAEFKNQPFHTIHFKYNEQQDFYTCPENQRLIFYKTSEYKERKHHFKHYRVDELHMCKHCPFRKQCVSSNAARRVIKRESRQHLKDEMKQRLNSELGRQMYRKRLHPVESFFGHIKYNLGYTQFLLRGLAKVKAEFILMCLTYNLRKLIAKLIYFLIIFNPPQKVLMIRKCNHIVIPNLSMNFLKHFEN